MPALKLAGPASSNPKTAAASRADQVCRFTAVQIDEYRGGRRRIVAHVGSAKTEAELGLLVQQARDRLKDDRQGVLDLGIEPQVAKVPLVSVASELALFAHPSAEVPASGASINAARVLSTCSRMLFDALAAVFTDLGFDRGRRHRAPPKAAPTCSTVMSHHRQRVWQGHPVHLL
ncbi:MAG: hypothetical protein ACOH2F_03635 [Cellulomonas sp.]